MAHLTIDTGHDFTPGTLHLAVTLGPLHWSQPLATNIGYELWTDTPCLQGNCVGINTYWLWLNFELICFKSYQQSTSNKKTNIIYILLPTKYI